MYIYQPVHINTKPNSNEDLIMMGNLKIVSKNEGMINEVSCFVLFSGSVMGSSRPSSSVDIH